MIQSGRLNMEQIQPNHMSLAHLKIPQKKETSQKVSKREVTYKVRNNSSQRYIAKH